MPMFKRPDAEIHYTVTGKGFPILLYAPGGLKSEMNMWGGQSTVYRSVSRPGCYSSVNGVS